MSLFWRIFLLNAAVLVVATALLLLGPATVSTPVLFTEVVIAAGGVGVMLAANAVLFRMSLAPLRRLTRAMTTTDLLRPGRRLDACGQGEFADLITTFNTMLDRLEAERAASSSLALSAQEAERRRIAQELHDEVGQTLTVVLLDLKRVADQVPEPLREDLRRVQETTRAGLDEIRWIARRLRPGVLDELGLTSALTALAHEITAHAGLTVRRSYAPDLPALDERTELVLYRVAQESLTNAARHARATKADLSLHRTADGVELVVADDGRGTGGAPEGSGIRGMRERALLIGARLALGPAPGGGTRVRMTVPSHTAPRADAPPHTAPPADAPPHTAARGDDPLRTAAEGDT
ncbi:HAMP domain-containing sensor histidine kinase [Streptomyces indicus]|uniref:histidine kinase n=1 Tax=Streptomyces indicus TaxID=417292 RepID=A0A1G8T6X6_9ACTN|nr:HAMP domain-containing sensor histidine kinase [Streptomyces indicus]SDJ37131.1 two-component system, NarL family, sensor histidine kinase UhpB [Streptomyces indicus]